MEKLCRNNYWRTLEKLFMLGHLFANRVSGIIDPRTSTGLDAPLPASPQLELWHIYSVLHQKFSWVGVYLFQWPALFIYCSSIMPIDFCFGCGERHDLSDLDMCVKNKSSRKGAVDSRTTQSVVLESTAPPGWPNRTLMTTWASWNALWMCLAWRNDKNRRFVRLRSWNWKTSWPSWRKISANYYNYIYIFFKN